MLNSRPGTTLFPYRKKGLKVIYSIEAVPRFRPTAPTANAHGLKRHAQKHTMDSPIVAQLFRQLFRHRPRGCLGYNAQLRSSTSRCLRQTSRQTVRAYATRPSIDRGMKTNESRWQQRTNILPDDRRSEFAEYPYISIDELKLRTERPRRVKMLLRDFIDGMRMCSVQISLFFS